MIIGVPTEIKTDEYRVGLTPVGVDELRRAGHTILIQAGAGAGSGIPDEDYARQGAEIVSSARTIFSRAELVVTEITTSCRGASASPSSRSMRGRAASSSPTLTAWTQMRRRPEIRERT